jgi:hypothetical protein
MSAYGGKPEVMGAGSDRRELPIGEFSANNVHAAIVSGAGSACRFDRRDRPAATWRALPLSARSLLRASLLVQGGRAKKKEAARPRQATTSVVLL